MDLPPSAPYCLDLPQCFCHHVRVAEETIRERLARYMDERRQELGLTWDQVAAKGSITTETLRQIRIGDRPIRPLTRRAIEVALDWQAGTIGRVLAGEQLDNQALAHVGTFIAQLRSVLNSRFSADTRLRMIEEMLDEFEDPPSNRENSQGEVVTGG